VARRTAVLAAFVDESYTDPEDVFALACVLADGPSLARLCDGLDAVAGDAAGFGVAATAELHAYEMFHGKGEWERLAGKARAQVALYTKAFEAIKASGCEVLTRSTQPSKLDATAPHEIVLRYLVEELDRIAERRDEHILIICDSVSEGPQHRADLRNSKRSGTGGYKSRKLERILDTMHFADSHDSRGLQAADLVAFLHRRILRNENHTVDERERNAVEQVWSRLGGSTSEGGCILGQRNWPT